MKFNNDETKMDKKKFDLYKNYLKQISNINGILQKKSNKKKLD